MPGLSPSIFFLPSVVAVQAIRDVLGSLFVARSCDRLAGIRDYFVLLSVNWEIFGFQRFFIGHCVSPLAGQLPRPELDNR
jgi:hypothetical protein